MNHSHILCKTSSKVVEFHSLHVYLQCTSSQIYLLCPYALRITCLILILWFQMYFRSFALNSHEYLSCIIRDLLKRKWGPIYLSIFSHEGTSRGWIECLKNMENNTSAYLSSPVVFQEAVADTLEELWISYNFIEKLRGIRVMKKLKVLYMSNNLVKDWGKPRLSLL